MNNKLTQKQENFVLNLFQGMSQREAYVQAGYSSKNSPNTIDRHAFDLANKDKIVARYEELRQKAEDESVATVLERKQRLTYFIREDVESDKGVLLRSGNIQATAELNKMEKIYSETTVNIDNRKVEITVSGERAKQLTEQIIEGERTD